MGPEHSTQHLETTFGNLALLLDSKYNAKQTFHSPCMSVLNNVVLG